MPAAQPNAVRCTLSRGGFSEERIFRIKLPGGKMHVGAAPRQYCYHRKGLLLGPDEPAPKAQIDGKIVVRILREDGPGRILVYLPDGDVVPVTEDQLDHVKEVSPDVPVQP
jgi:hypothetical protein